MWDTIKEIYFSVKKTSTDRIKSPFYGVFVLTWLAFNWRPIAVILFSELQMEQRIGFVNAVYPFKFLLPLLVSSLLAYILPIINEKITFFQSKPISRTAVLLAIRKKRALVADISVEKYRAKRDVTYDRHVAGAEKEIQDMREEIVTSKDRLGELDRERDKLKGEVITLQSALSKTQENADRFSNEAQEQYKIAKESQEKINMFRINTDALSKESQELRTITINKQQEINSLLEEIKELKAIISAKDKNEENDPKLILKALRSKAR